MMEELEHSEFLSDKILDIMAKIYTVSFTSELNTIETNLSIWTNGTEYLCFSLKLGNTWLSTWIETEVFDGDWSIETVSFKLKDKVLDRQKNDLRFKAFIALEEINGDFK